MKDTDRPDNRIPPPRTSAGSDQGGDVNNPWKLRRSEPRVVLKIPITLDGKDKSGEAFTEETFTENVSRQGACVETVHYLEVGTVLQVSAFEKRFRSKARVTIVWSKKSASNRFRIGLRFLDPLANWVVI
jgi:hypothetical protein